MNRIHRCLGAAAALGGALLTLAVAAPAALATIPDPGGGGLEPGTQPESITVVTGGMPGWQITLIAVGAALVAAVVAVLLNRAWTARRSVPARAD